MTGTRSLLRVSGFVVWAFAGIPSMLSLLRDPEGFSWREMLVWIFGISMFGAAFFEVTKSDAIDAKAGLRWLLIETAAALLMNVVFCTGFEAALLVIVAVQLGWLLPGRFALLWLAVQSAMIYGLAGHHMGYLRAGYFLIAVCGAEVFAFTIAAMARRESLARRELERTNAELEATRESLARASRDAERLRISRELHDLVGHSLIVLHLELEVLRHIVQDDPSKERVARALSVARGLLEDVRSAVSTLKEEPGAIDIANGIRSVIAKVKEPSIHFEAPDALHLPDMETATTIVRCVQEIVTNTIKHAGAKNLWITIGRQNGCLQVSARDDGRGAEAIEPGNGLVGMKDRFTKLGGALEISAEQGAGFRLRATIPMAEDKTP